MTDYTGQTCIECHEQLAVTAFDGNRYCVNPACHRFGLWTEAYERIGRVTMVGYDSYTRPTPFPKTYKFSKPLKKEEKHEDS